MCGCLSCRPHWGPGLQPQACALTGNRTNDTSILSPCSIHWATPARAIMIHFDAEIFPSLVRELLNHSLNKSLFSKTSVLEFSPFCPAPDLKSATYPRSSFWWRMILRKQDFLIFIFREREREEERGEKHQCAVASHIPPTGDLAPRPRHVPWVGIEQVTLVCRSCSIHWATLPGKKARS